ncbi:MAG TPA: YtxH domain-containing protein [Bryobacteraceae bacterium]|nr:YtxH domain-containing protein [Bryobacteraceae bacterium]
MESNNGMGFLLGFGAGVALGMLFAPQSGEETRNYLQAKAEDTARQLKEQSSRMMDTANETIGRAKDIANQTIGRAKGMMQQESDQPGEPVGV